MSARDISESGEAVQKLCGRGFQLSVATNSLKFQFPSAGMYLWIDPPWQILSNGVAVLSSDSYPDQNADGYEERFQAWASSVHVRVRGFESVSFGSDGVSFALGNSVALWLPNAEVELSHDSWYDHWYVGKSRMGSKSESRMG